MRPTSSMRTVLTMNRRRTSLLLSLCGLLLAAVAVALGAYNLWDDQRAGAEAESALKKIVQHRETAAEMPSQKASPEPTPDPDREMPVLEMDGYRCIGTISIPVINVELPVQDSWSPSLLKASPCCYKGTVYRGDLIICAHNYATHFGRLKNLLPGDEVIFTDIDGNEYHYTVTEMDTLSGTAVEEMESGQWDLTLFTCTLEGRTRVTVRCDLTESVC